ncbi:SapC family protein [Quisquiliibacterium transsilvanicum]|uniref:SapC family protein n=1 Tax=Quisquiliibacterium transsilvanicum TaxID=1549638 RepID=A0A7W8M8W0_9BURK|nr:SapC family protein [Quisquiliibacterium transsilvanicum]MBB5272037.1 hypothetical protein [Quisquiliibacterium transsilvanicum]
MPKHQPVSPDTHGAKRWKRYDGYAFAAGDTAATLVAQEMPAACPHFPVAFLQLDGHFTPVAVQGLQGGRNLFVAPDGRWLGGYVPAAYRGHPFALADTPDGQAVLCVDADSGLIGDTEGEPFFDADGTPAKPLQEVFVFLQKVRADRQATQRICDALAEERLIIPWPLTVKDGGREISLQGLHRIDEDRLKALGAETLHRLHGMGAVGVAYAQLLSLQHLKILGRLAQLHAQWRKPTEPSAPAENAGSEGAALELMEQNGTISFGGA